MALLKIPKSQFPVKLTKELISQMNMMGIPLEQETEKELEIEVLPNRPDALSATGFIRAFMAFIGKQTGLKQYKINTPEKNFTVKIDPNLKNIRPYTTCAIVKGLKFNDEKIKEIIDIQEKLHTTVGRNRKKVAIGIYPLEKITLPIKFEARKPQDIKFVPLESDREMNGLQILQTHPKGRDYAHLLEGLEKYPVFVDANNKILSLPPIINSHDTGKITEETTDIFIECSGFDFNVLHKTLIIITTTLADLGGKVYAMNLDYGGKKTVTPNLTPEKMKISLENINKLLGLKLTEKDLERLLPRMGYDYKNKIVTIPPWRVDILHEVDIAEDVAIAYGYDNLEPEIPKVSTIGEEAPLSRLKNKIAEILIGFQMMEISTFHLIKPEEDKTAIELLDSKTEYKSLRPNLLIPMLRTLVSNRDNEYPQNLFEIGTVFGKGNTETGILEEEHLCIALCHDKTDFTAIKQVVDALLHSLGVEYQIKACKNETYIEGRVAEILVSGKSIGVLGEIHPAVLEKLGLIMPVVAAELDVERLGR